MKTRTCPICKVEKPLDDYYEHPLAKEGRMHKCKPCHAAGVRANYRAKREMYAQYDRERFQTPERKARALEYQSAMRKKYPEKYRARGAVMKAVRSGKLTRPSSCSHCGVACKPQAHHDDYSKPLEVRWFCFKCHREVGHGQTVTVVDYQL